ncbi:putative conidiation-specific protein (con-13) protein [Paramyrothecium foliicola]|nr:putative conidiation-specific protein (con-13) protein [Paramyrothecium foliicola]
MNNELKAVLPVVAHTAIKWAPGWVPSACFLSLYLEDLERSDFEVYNVTYSDCPEPFVVCRHKDTPASPELIFASIGRLRARMRQWVSEFVAIPTIRPQYAAWQTGPVVIVQDEWWELPALMVHELVHVVDLMRLGPRSHSGGYGYWSATGEDGTWPRAVAHDGKVLTEYARTNWIESFAVAGEHQEFNSRVGGGLAALGPMYQEVEKQLAYASGYLAPELYYTGQCTQRVQSSNPWPVLAATFKGSIEELGPKPNVTITKVPQINVPEEVYKMKPVCEKLLD